MHKLLIKIVFGIFVVAVGYSAYILVSAPNPKILNSCFTTKMNRVELCKASKNYVRLQEVSQNLRDAILVSEDIGFYGHDGFDWREIWRSFITNLKRGKLARGGSTITQQLAKNTFLTGKKNIHRKILEAYLSLLIEKNYSKDFIFEKYLNVVEFGKGVFGVSAAAEEYFSLKPSELGVLESAFLAHLLPNPTVYSQGFKKGQLSDFNLERIEDIVTKMYKFKKIGSLEYELAIEKIRQYKNGS